jgi:hypothetical protein
MATKCVQCSAEGGFFKGLLFQQIKGRDYCHQCAAEFVRDAIARIQMTTTPSLDGFHILRYIDIESVEIVAGTGMFSEFGGDVADFFGARSGAFEQKPSEGKADRARQVEISSV